MRFFSVLPVAAASGFALLLTAGCASSERMTRLSGGVIAKHSAPTPLRVRSEKYRMARNFSSSGRAGKLDLNDTLINIWPFFYRSNDYISVLWPMLDFDPYGMAFRPFFNHEGDEYSILFPLSGWNREARNGWAGPVVWGRDFFGLIPLAWHSLIPASGCFWYTPLWIHSWRHETPSFRSPLREATFTEFLLGYYSSETRVDTSDYAWLNHYDRAEMRREMAYRFGKTGQKIPKNDSELERWQDAVFAELPDRKIRKWGFFPLLHVSREPRAREILIPSLLTWAESRPNSFDLTLLAGLIGWWRTRDIKITPLDSASSEWVVLPLLTGYEWRRTAEPTAPVQAFRKLHRQSYLRAWNHPEIAMLLEKLEPGLKLPKTVTDGNTLRLFLADWAAERNFPAYDELEVGCLPLFRWEDTRDRFSWFSLALMSGYNRSADGKDWKFLSFPLMTMFSRKPGKSISTVLTPLTWLSTFEREKRIHRPILDRSQLWTAKSNMSEFTDQFAACFLFYHGVNGFYVVKPGLDAMRVERARNLFLQIAKELRQLRERGANLNRRETANRAWRPNGKIDGYRKLIAEEEIFQQRTNLDRDAAGTQVKIAELRQSCENLGFPFSSAALESTAAVEAELEKFFDAVAELRQVEDYGNGVLYRKERYCNGDFNWNVLGFVAGGEKKGEDESSHLLHFLYRSRRQGVRSETVMFPFFSMQRDGENSRFSFLWRVFERTRRNGKTGGHILFIPY